MACQSSPPPAGLPWPFLRWVLLLGPLANPSDLSLSSPSLLSLPQLGAIPMEKMSQLYRPSAPLILLLRSQRGQQSSGHRNRWWRTQDRTGLGFSPNVGTDLGIDPLTSLGLALLIHEMRGLGQSSEQFCNCGPWTSSINMLEMQVLGPTPALLTQNL